MSRPVPTTLSRVYADIYAERQYQIAKWGEQHRALGTGSKSWQNRAEKAKARCDAAELDSKSDDTSDKASWAAILEEEFAESMAEKDPKLVRAELIQTAAVCVAIIEDIEKNHAPDLGDETLYL